MAVIETKFSVGDVVFYASTTTETKQHPCPDCLGERKWKALSPAGDEFSFGCPRCSARYSSFDKLNLNYTAHVGYVRRLTIGSVRHDSHKPETLYMAYETGVGSGNLYAENRLFADEGEARRCADALAATANATTEWTIERYNSTLEISDYQLASARLKEADDARHRANSMLYNLSYLFEKIEEADDKDAILEEIDWYRKYDWQRDKARIAQGIEARSDETAQQAQPEGQEPGGEAMRSNNSANPEQING